MTLIKSISGIRGTIGGKTGENLTPIDAALFASAFAKLVKKESGKSQPLLVLGRDARLSGDMIASAVKSALSGMGIQVIDLGLSTTPSVEMAVRGLGADGGIILTASHNPVEWNALKLLNKQGEFISAGQGKEILQYVENQDFEYAQINDIGTIKQRRGGYIAEHIEAILNLPEVNPEAIRKNHFKVVIDAVHSTGGLAVPALLDKLGVSYRCLYCEPTGIFPHNPEPLEKHLTEIMKQVTASQADLGIVVDPDVDRLALIDEKGQMFGEEYTLVAVADYILRKKKGPVVSNLSSSRALKDLAAKYNVPYYASAVGEVNVVKKMKETGAIIGGEGNGGVIFPKLHYGRDALVGIALILSFLAESGNKLSELRKKYPAYFMVKEKIQLSPDIDVDRLLEKFEKSVSGAQIDKTDGLKIDFPSYWIHLRKSNTEPIIRIYVEAQSLEQARKIAETTIEQLKKLI